MTFRRILNRNIILITFPIVLILFVFRMVLGQTLLLPYFACSDYGGEKVSSEMLYHAGNKNVERSLENLHYSGFDEVLEGKTIGRYYYRDEGGKLQFYLLQTSTVSCLEEAKGNEKTVTAKFRIESREDTIRGFMNSYEQDLGIEGFEGLSYSYVYDEISYPQKMIDVIRAAREGFLFLMAVFVLYMLLSLCFPALNFEAWPLKKYGDIPQAIRKLNREMKKRYICTKGNEIQTKNFHIFVQILRIDVFTNEEYEE